MKMTAVCQALCGPQPTNQSVGDPPRNPPAASRVCQKHLFHLPGGKPAVPAWATQNNPHHRMHEAHARSVHLDVLIPSGVNVSSWHWFLIFFKSINVFLETFLKRWGPILQTGVRSVRKLPEHPAAAEWPACPSLSSLSHSSSEWRSSPLACGRGVKRWVACCSRASRLLSVAFLNRRGMSPPPPEQCARERNWCVGAILEPGLSRGGVRGARLLRCVYFTAEACSFSKYDKVYAINNADSPMTNATVA